MPKIKRNNLALAYAFTAIGLSTITSAHASWPFYKLNLINGDAGLTNSALGINYYGKACGQANISANNFTGLYGAANTSSTFYNMPSGWSSLAFNYINNYNQTAGTATPAYVPSAIAYTPNGTMYNMCQGLENVFSWPVGLNQNGIAVGQYNKEGNSGVETHTFRYSFATHARTADIPDLLPGGVDENGMLVGSNMKVTNFYQFPELRFVTLNNVSTTSVANGNFTYIYPSALSTFGGSVTVGNSFGPYANAIGTYFRGFWYNRTQNLWGFFPGLNGADSQTNALSIDTWGTKAVGYVQDAAKNQSAMVWENVGGTWTATDANTLIAADPNWKLTNITSINVFGAMSGFGQHKEGGKWIKRAFTLTPTNMVRMPVLEHPIYGGLIFTDTVIANSPTPFTIDILLDTTAGAAVFPSFPGEVRLANNQSQANFTVKTAGVDRDTYVTINAHLGDFTASQTVLVHKAAIASLNFTSNSDGSIGQVGLMGATGPSGATLRLRSSNPNITVPSTVAIPANSTGARFRILPLKGAKAGDTSTITAYLGDGSVSQTFTLG